MLEAVSSLELQHSILGNVIVGHWLLERVDFVQQIFSNFEDGLYLELLHHIFYIAAGSSI